MHDVMKESNNKHMYQNQIPKSLECNYSHIRKSMYHDMQSTVNTSRSEFVSG